MDIAHICRELDHRLNMNGHLMRERHPEPIKHFWYRRLPL